MVRVKSNGSGAAESGSTGGDVTVSGSLSLNRSDMTLSAGESFALQASGASGTVIWSVADSGVATVNGSGKVTGVSKGTTSVTATCNGRSAKCTVRVK